MQNNILNNVSLIDGVFGKDLLLLDSVNELFELELAFLESQALSREELLSRSAFFKTVNGNPTNHFKLCQPFNGHKHVYIFGHPRIAIFAKRHASDDRVRNIFFIQPSRQVEKRPVNAALALKVRARFAQ